MNFILRWYPSPKRADDGLWGFEGLNAASCDVVNKLLKSEDWILTRFENKDDDLSDEPFVAPSDIGYSRSSSDSVLLLLNSAGISRDEVIIEAPLWKMCEPGTIESLRKDQTWRLLLYEADVKWQEILKLRQERKESLKAQVLQWVSEVMPMVERLEREKRRPN